MLGLALGGAFLVFQASGVPVKVFGGFGVAVGLRMVFKFIGQFKTPTVRLTLSPEGIQARLYFKTQNFDLPWEQFESARPVTYGGNRMVGIFAKDPGFGIEGATESEAFARKSTMKEAGTWMAFAPRIFGHSTESLSLLIEKFAYAANA